MKSILARRLLVTAGRLRKKAVKEYFDEQEILEVLNDGLPDLRIEALTGHEREFANCPKEPLPFSYGEIPNYINPADDMGWDVIIVPSAVGLSRSELAPVGIVRYNTDVDYWDVMPGDDPIGNDKILLGKRGEQHGEYTHEDSQVLAKFFKDKDAFETPNLFWDYV